MLNILRQELQVLSKVQAFVSGVASFITTDEQLQ